MQQEDQLIMRKEQKTNFLNWRNWSDESGEFATRINLVVFNL